MALSRALQLSAIKIYMELKGRGTSLRRRTTTSILKRTRPRTRGLLRPPGKLVVLIVSARYGGDLKWFSSGSRESARNFPAPIVWSTHMLNKRPYATIGSNWSAT